MVGKLTRPGEKSLGGFCCAWTGGHILRGQSIYMVPKGEMSDAIKNFRVAGTADYQYC